MSCEDCNEKCNTCEEKEQLIDDDGEPITIFRHKCGCNGSICTCKEKTSYYIR